MQKQDHGDIDDESGEMDDMDDNNVVDNDDDIDNDGESEQLEPGDDGLSSASPPPR